MKRIKYNFNKPGYQCAVLFLGMFISGGISTKMFSQSQRSPVILESARLEISGTTTISDFKCHLLQQNSNDTLSYVSDKLEGAELFEGMEFQFRVSNFVCDKSLMTSDLKYALKESEFPYITMKINKVTSNGQVAPVHSHSISAHITLHIAGYADHDYIENALITNTANRVTLTGIHNVLMTRFQIEPPTKLFGTVRTEDAIGIAFSIILSSK